MPYKTIFYQKLTTILSKWRKEIIPSTKLLVTESHKYPSNQLMKGETMVEQISKEIDAIEKRIDFLWDDKSQSIEKRGQEIDRLSKLRFKLMCRLQDLNLKKMGYC